MNPKAPIQWGPLFFNEDKHMRPGDNNNGYDDHQKGTEDDDGECFSPFGSGRHQCYQRQLDTK